MCLPDTYKFGMSVRKRVHANVYTYTHAHAKFSFFARVRDIAWRAFAHQTKKKNAAAVTTTFTEFYVRLSYTKTTVPCLIDVHHKRLLHYRQIPVKPSQSSLNQGNFSLPHRLVEWIFGVNKPNKSTFACYVSQIQ